MSEGPFTVGRLLHALLDLPPAWDGQWVMDAVLQVTFDGEEFFAVDSIEEWHDGGIVAQLVPFPAPTNESRRSLCT